MFPLCLNKSNLGHLQISIKEFLKSTLVKLHNYFSGFVIDENVYLQKHFIVRGFSIFFIGFASRHVLWFL